MVGHCILGLAFSKVMQRSLTATGAIIVAEQTRWKDIPEMHSVKSRLTTATFVTAIALATIGVGTAHADQPDMYAARNDLQQAIGSLQAAQDDKGGHRVAAIGLAQQAIEQVNLGIQFAGGPSDGEFPPPPPQFGPAMVSGNGYLQAAVNELEAATADKGGHRVAALSLTQQAIDEVNQGIQVGGPF